MSKLVSCEKYLTLDDVSIRPQYSEIESRSMCDISSYVTRHYKLNVPIISANMDTITEYEMAHILGKLGGLGIIHRFMSIEKQCHIINELFKNNILTSAAIGVKHEDIERSLSLLKAGCKIILVDVAHAHHILVKRIMKELVIMKNDYEFDIMVGNVATGEAICDLIEWGADSIKTMVGSGSQCSTRIQAATGTPSFTTIIECFENVKKIDSDVPLIFDGGIKTSGDVAKAIGGGANCVMLGSLLAGTDETPGTIRFKGLYPNSGMIKTYRGSASFESKIDRGEKGMHVEGMSSTVPYKGSVKNIVQYISDGLKSAMSYSGSINIKTFQEKCQFVIVSHSGQIEAMPHLEFFK